MTQGNVFWFVAGTRGLTFLESVQTGSGTRPSSYCICVLVYSVVMKLERVTSHSVCIVFYNFMTWARTALPLWHHSPIPSIFSGPIFQNASLRNFYTYFFLSYYLVMWRAHLVLSVPLSEEYWVGLCLCRGVDKSLVLPGRKQPNVCQNGVNFLWRLVFQGGNWQLASRPCWNRARPWHASELVSFLFWLRIYQHPSITKFAVI